jgi:hypothetical protein
VRPVVRWVAFGAGVGGATLVGRALVGNAAGVVAAVLSDFEARRTDVPRLEMSGTHKTTRTPSTKLPPRLKADIAYARSVTPQTTIDLTESPETVS